MCVSADGVEEFAVTAYDAHNDTAVARQSWSCLNVQYRSVVKRA
jgi:hypothetical protein